MSILKNLEYRSSSATVFTFTLTQVGDNTVEALFFSTTCGSSSAGGASPSCVAGTSTAAPGAPAGPAGVAGDDSAVVAEAAVVVVAIVGEVTLFNSGTESSLLSRIAEYKYITPHTGRTCWNCYQPKLSSMREILAATPSIRSSATTQSLMMMMSMLIMVVVMMVMVVVSVVYGS